MNEAGDDPERRRYEALQAYSLGHGGPGFIHQHVVDAWTAQHADERTKPIALAFALIGLCLHLEHGFSGRQVQKVHMRLARRRRDWPPFRLPRERGPMRVDDVMAAPAGAARDQAIEAWCASVWGAFADGHGAVTELLERLDVLRRSGTERGSDRA